MTVFVEGNLRAFQIAHQVKQNVINKPLLLREGKGTFSPSHETRMILSEHV